METSGTVTVDTPELKKAQEDLKKAHVENSNLGRKVKMLADQFAAFTAAQEASTPIPNETPSNGTDDGFEIPTTQAEWDAQQDKTDARKEAARQKRAAEYQNSYIEKVHALGAQIDQEEFTKIYAEMYNSYNRPEVSNTPGKDAEINFMKAQASLLKKKQNKVHGGTEIPLDTGFPSTTQNNGAPKTVKLEGAAADYAKQMGMTDEEVSKALSTPLPPGMSMGGEVM
jgi:hypothetical protein